MFLHNAGLGARVTARLKGVFKVVKGVEELMDASLIVVFKGNRRVLTSD